MLKWIDNKNSKVQKKKAATVREWSITRFVVFLSRFLEVDLIFCHEGNELDKSKMSINLY